MSKERFEVFGNVIKDNEDIPSLLNNYQATVRLNELNDKVKELEQELAKLKEKYNKANEKLKNITEEVENNYVYGEDYVKLKQELAELKERAIVPKFRIGQEVYSLFINREYMEYSEVCNLEITHIMKSKDGIFYQDNNNNAYWFNEKDTFLTEQEAQAKLKEIQGNE